MSDSDLFRCVLGHFCTGLVIVTSSVGDKPVGMTAQSFTSLSLEPPMILFCPAKTSTTWPLIHRSGRFCVNILGEHQEHVSRQFAQSGTDKFSSVRWYWSDNGNPRLDDCISHIECTLEAVHEAGDHRIAVGRVGSLSLGSPTHPLIFFKGAYRQLRAKPI